MAIYGNILNVLQNLAHLGVNQEIILILLTQFLTFLTHLSVHNLDLAQFSTPLGQIPNHCRVMMTQKHVTLPRTSFMSKQV